ncbi:hypothetical protein KFU94_56725 [Chloroflexi bacterium TSY]|nr:hypothetical protein [Chloroflexi bacterium TSY]
MLQGIYCDRVLTDKGPTRFRSGWTANTIVDTAWPLLAGLLKREDGLQGILYCAVGSGDANWDRQPQAASPAATQLVNEIDRHRLADGDIHFLDANGVFTTQPTNRLQISASFSWAAQSQTLREFGLFGGNATEDANSGTLINYVIHPRIELAAGETLVRRVQLRFDDLHQAEPDELPRHGLGASPVLVLDGVGDRYGDRLAEAGLATLEDLARVGSTPSEIDVPLMKLLELRAKARLAIRSVRKVRPIDRLLNETVGDILTTPVATVAANANVAENQIVQLREQLELLQLALDSQFLRIKTIGELIQS